MTQIQLPICDEVGIDRQGYLTPQIGIKTPAIYIGPSGSEVLLSALIYNSIGVSSYTQYMQDNNLPAATSFIIHTTNVQNWLLDAQLQAYKLRPIIAGDNITQRTCIEAVYPRGGYPNEGSIFTAKAISSPIIVPNYVGLNFKEAIIRTGSSGTITSTYTGDTTSQALANLCQPTVIFPPGSHNIADLNINCNSNGSDHGSGVWVGKNWTVNGIAIQAGGSGYTNGDVLTGINPDGAPYFPFTITVTGVDGSGAITSATRGSSGSYGLPSILQQRQWTAANATFTGYAALGNVFDPNNAGWYLVTGGTGTGAKFTVSWNADFSGGAYVGGNALICDTMLNKMSIQQAGTVLDATYGPMFGIGFSGLNHEFDHLTIGGGYYGLLSKCADLHGGTVNPVNSRTGIKIATGGSQEFTAIIDTPSYAGIEIDSATEIFIDGFGINVGSALTGPGFLVIGGDTALSGSTHRASGIHVDMNIQNTGGTSVPAAFLDYMTGVNDIRLNVSNSTVAGATVAHPHDTFATFGSNNTSIGTVIGAIDKVTGNIFTGTVPKEGIRVWDASIGGWAIGSAMYQLSGSGSPTSGGSGTGLNKAGIGSIYTDYLNGGIYTNIAAASSPAWSGRILLASSGIQQSFTGGTGNHTLATFTLPANLLTSSTILRIHAAYHAATGATRNVGFSVTFGGSVTLNSSVSVASAITFVADIDIANNNATNSQTYTGSYVNNLSGSNAIAEGALSIDTTSSVIINIIGNIANAADTVFLDNYMIELIRSV